MRNERQVFEVPRLIRWIINVYFHQFITWYNAFYVVVGPIDEFNCSLDIGGVPTRKHMQIKVFVERMQEILDEGSDYDTELMDFAFMAK